MKAIEAVGIAVSISAALVAGYRLGLERGLADGRAARHELAIDFAVAISGWQECITLAEEGRTLVMFYRQAALGAGLREDERPDMLMSEPLEAR